MGMDNLIGFIVLAIVIAFVVGLFVVGRLEDRRRREQHGVWAGKRTRRSRSR